jgi:hypothetical protein
MSFSTIEKLEMRREQNIGVAIKALDASRAMHVGLLYAHSSGEVRFAHLAFHHDLRNDPVPTGQGYLWSVCEWLNGPAMGDTAKFIANYIEAVMQSGSDVDYGMNPADVGFDNAGRYYSLDPKRGLTCATFVAAVFQSAGFRIVELGTWPSRPSDADFRSHVLAMLKLNGEDERAEEIEKEVVPFRLSPAEAAAAAAAAIVPVAYDAALKLAEPLLQELFTKVIAPGIGA